jgi:hypothetical protein
MAEGGKQQNTAYGVFVQVKASNRLETLYPDALPITFSLMRFSMLAFLTHIYNREFLVTKSKH